MSRITIPVFRFSLSRPFVRPSAAPLLLLLLAGDDYDDLGSFAGSKRREEKI